MVEYIYIYITNSSHTKKFLIRPDENFTKQLLKFDKRNLRTIVGIITGHVGLNAYLARMGIRADQDCDHCSHLEETAHHFLCECTGFSQTKSRIFGTNAITAETVMSKPLGKIIAFVQESQRFRNEM